MRTKARHYYPPIKKCRGSTLSAGALRFFFYPVFACVIAFGGARDFTTKQQRATYGRRLGALV